jgi:hypothetical protein
MKVVELIPLCHADFKDDPYIYAFDSLKYIGIELWQVNAENFEAPVWNNGYLRLSSFLPTC